MEAIWKYRGRILNDEQIEFIRTLIQANPQASRWSLSRRLCQAWNWVQANGAPCEMLCRGMMLALDRAGRIELPPVRRKNPNPLAERRSPARPLIDTTPLSATLADLRPLEFRLVRRTPEEAIFNGLIEHHHYLGYTQPVGEHLKYIVYADQRPIACLAWSSAPRHLAPRDRFIGWGPEARRQNIRFIAYNTRFLILPWVRVPHLASYILARMARLLPVDWQRLYRHPVYYLETFIDPERFRGTCYRAANWIPLGLTTGRGKNDHTFKPNRSLKEVLGYPLAANFRKLLQAPS